MRIKREYLVVITFEVEQIGPTSVAGNTIHRHPEKFVFRLVGVLESPGAGLLRQG